MNPEASAHDRVKGSATATLPENCRHQTEVAVRQFAFRADDPADGMEPTGPTPTEYLLAALASCTAITLRSYADRKYDYAGNIEVTVTLHEPDVEGAEKFLHRTITLTEQVPEDDLLRMQEIAEQTPVTMLLAYGHALRTDFVSP